jgi:hypothetical protein
VECLDKRGAETKERGYIESLGAELNKNIPTITNKEAAERHKKWNEEHREYISIKAKEYYANNKEKVTLRGKVYREKNAEKVAKYQKEYRLRKKLEKATEALETSQMALEDL